MRKLVEAILLDKVADPLGSVARTAFWTLAYLIAGTVFLSLAFGWKVGVGVALLTIYNKT